MTVRSQVYRAGRPVVLAHRGGMAEAPENTLAGIEHMLSCGVTVLETDIRHTRDGIPVLAHDATLIRRFGDERDVSDVSWQELSDLRDVDGQAPLRLEDVLRGFPQVIANLDLKTDEAVSPSLRLIRQLGAADRVCLTAFSSRRVSRIMRITRGGAMIGMGMADVAQLIAWASLPSRTSELVPKPWSGQDPRAIQVPLTFRGVPVVTSRLLQRAHSVGHVVHVWTVNEVDDMNRLLDLGVDGLVTDVPSVAAEVFASRGLPLV